MFTEPEYPPADRRSRERRLIALLLVGPAAIGLTCLVLVAAAQAFTGIDILDLLFGGTGPGTLSTPTLSATTPALPATWTETISPTPSLTFTPSATFTASATRTPTPTTTPTGSLTPTRTPTRTITPTPTKTATLTLTPSVTPSPTQTETPTETLTPTLTQTLTPTTGTP